MVQDNTKPLDKMVYQNKGIKEVYEMLQTFTRDDHLRERYRLQEEFLRVRKTEQFELEMVNEKYLKEKQAKEAAQKDREATLKEVANLKKSSILFMKKLGIAKEEISQSLNIPQADVEMYFE